MKKMNAFKVLGLVLATLLLLVGIHFNGYSNASATTDTISHVSKRVYKSPEVDHALISYEQREEKMETVRQAKAKAEAERIAEEKRVAEEAREKAEKIAQEEREKAAQEKAKQAEASYVAQKTSKVATKQVVVNEKKTAPKKQVTKTEPAKTNAPAQKTQKAVQKSAPAPRTDGFNYNGHHYPIVGFSGSGRVPANNNVYKWNDWQTNHYLIELYGNAGKTIWNVNVGTKVTVNGKTYTVQGKKSKIDRVKDGTNFLISVSSPSGITFQSCDPGPGDTVTIWWAK